MTRTMKGMPATKDVTVLESASAVFTLSGSALQEIVDNVPDRKDSAPRGISGAASYFVGTRAVIGEQHDLDAPCSQYPQDYLKP